jgi:hypothetical protein
MPRSRRRSARGRVLLWIAPLAAAAAVTAAVVIALPKEGPLSIAAVADSASPLAASYQAGSSWGTGYTGQYTITNPGAVSVTGWTLGFQLPNGTSISSLWDGSYTDDRGQMTVTSDSWDSTIQPGGSVSIGFVTTSTGEAGQPSDCTINGASCQGGAPPSPSTTASPVPSASATSTAPSTSASPSTSPSLASPSPSASASLSATPSPSTSSGSPTAGAAGFAPYVDTSLFPPFNLVTTAQATGVRQFNLAFVVSGGGGCTPEWGGVTAIGDDPVAAQIAALRAIGGDVRISFGGEDGSELAQTCTSVSQLEAAYQQVISAYDVNKIDFDIEGAAVDDTAANALRDQALVALQKANPGLQVSFTLPALPSGLPSDEDAILTGAVQAGVNISISAVNVMAMDYGDGAAPNPSGQMGTFAIDAATATDAQVASAMGISDAAAWSRVAVTPMIGVNDSSDEILTVANADPGRVHGRVRRVLSTGKPSRGVRRGSSPRTPRPGARPCTGAGDRARSADRPSGCAE